MSVLYVQFQKNWIRGRKAVKEPSPLHALAASEPTEQSALLRLPRELRDLIYEYVFGGVIHVVRNVTKTAFPSNTTYMSYRTVICHDPVAHFRMYDKNLRQAYSVMVDSNLDTSYSPKHPRCFERVALENDMGHMNYLASFGLLRGNSCCRYPITSPVAMCPKHRHTWENRADVLSTWSATRPHRALLSTCRQVYHETRCLPLTLPAFDIHEMRHLPDFIEYRLRPDQRTLISSLQLQRCTAKLLAHAKINLPSLANLIITDIMPAAMEWVFRSDDGDNVQLGQNLDDVVLAIKRELSIGTRECPRPFASDVKIIFTVEFCSVLQRPRDVASRRQAAAELEQFMLESEHDGFEGNLLEDVGVLDASPR